MRGVAAVPGCHPSPILEAMMYLPLLLAAIILTSAIYLLLQYSSRALVIDHDEEPRNIDELPVRDRAKAA